MKTAPEYARHIECAIIKAQSEYRDSRTVAFSLQEFDVLCSEIGRIITEAKEEGANEAHRESNK